MCKDLVLYAILLPFLYSVGLVLIWKNRLKCQVLQTQFIILFMNFHFNVSLELSI